MKFPRKPIDQDAQGFIENIAMHRADIAARRKVKCSPEERLAHDRKIAKSEKAITELEANLANINPPKPTQ